MNLIFCFSSRDGGRGRGVSCKLYFCKKKKKIPDFSREAFIFMIKSFRLLLLFFFCFFFFKQIILFGGWWFFPPPVIVAFQQTSIWMGISMTALITNTLGRKCSSSPTVKKEIKKKKKSNKDQVCFSNTLIIVQRLFYSFIKKKKSYRWHPSSRICGSGCFFWSFELKFGFLSVKKKKKTENNNKLSKT